MTEGPLDKYAEYEAIAAVHKRKVLDPFYLGADAFMSSLNGKNLEEIVLLVAIPNKSKKPEVGIPSLEESGICRIDDCRIVPCRIFCYYGKDPATMEEAHKKLVAEFYGGAASPDKTALFRFYVKKGNSYAESSLPEIRAQLPKALKKAPAGLHVPNKQGKDKE